MDFDSINLGSDGKAYVGFVGILSVLPLCLVESLSLSLPLLFVASLVMSLFLFVAAFVLCLCLASRLSVLFLSCLWLVSG